MAKYEIVMPKMGESVEEATITKILKKVGDPIEEDEALLEIATDKVDSEIPSPVDGTITEIRYKENDVVAVGEVIAVIDLGGEAPAEDETDKPQQKPVKEVPPASAPQDEPKAAESEDFSQSDRFYSPLVKSIAQKEGISISELDSIQGTGNNGRVRKQDIMQYLEDRGAGKAQAPKPAGEAPTVKAPGVEVSAGVDDEIVEMDRMRKLIADHMVMSKRVSPHVTNMVEIDVTNMVLWREKVKDEFFKREKQKLTYMPIIIEAVAKALRDFPRVNASTDGNNIILRKKINVGIAVALPNGNLIVPVLKDADQKNLVGLTVEMNTLADRARNNKLSPDDIQGGTFSISNFGTFRNVMGTPIINQPQVAILAVGTIQKKPAVVETPTGDVIAIRHKMYLSLTYDHRVVDGALGGAFLRKLGDYLEAHDMNRQI